MKIQPTMAHQKISLKRMAKSKLIFDTSDPGTGKTRVQIDDFAARRRKKGGKALIIAPKSLLDSAWREDFQKFAPDMVVVCAYAENREKAFNMPADAYITNTDALVWLSKRPSGFFKGFDTLVVDESTSLKHRTSARSKAAAKIAKHFTYRRLMTGTPTSNGIADIWHQVFILDQGERLGKSFFGFRAAACTPKQVGPAANMVKWVDRPGIESIVGALLKDIVIRHRFEDCVDIPANHRYSVPYTLTKSHRSNYAEMEKEQLLMLKNTVITAINGGVVYTKLLQIASGAVYDAEGNYQLLDTGRYELVLDLVEARKHSVVFFNWQHQRDLLAAEADRRGLNFAIYDGATKKTERVQIVKDFQAGLYDVLFAHPQSAGHGLTLTKGTATIWASPTPNLEHFAQGWKRVHRIGQTEKTETIVVVAKDTVDEKVWMVLNEKDGRMSALLDELRILTS
jgi:SNF2 family DNA or RNA helicase